MRFTAIILTATFGLFIFMGCGEDNSSDVRKDARQSLGVQDRNVPVSENPQTLPPQPPAQAQQPANSTAAAGGASHYICPNNCEGSGGAAQANCPVCGTAYIHNQAFHNQASQPPATQITPTPPADANAGAAQNAAGVYHYTCPSGCEGGAAGAGSCASCGAALAHNTAFHN